MEPVEYFRTIARRWLVIVLMGALGAAGGLAYASSQPTLYKATSSVMVLSQRGATTNELVQGSTFTQNLVQTYTQLATMPAVLVPVINDLKLDTTPASLQDSVSAATPLNTVIIEITASDQSPKLAAAIANGVTDSLSQSVESLAPKGPDNVPSITMATVSRASESTDPYSPNVRLLLIAGLLGGLVLGVLYALAREVLDTGVRGEKDLERVTDVPLLGKVGIKRRRDPSGHAMRVMPRSALAESYRRICANLEFINVDHRPRTVLVTSPLMHDGKSTTALNLALAMAERVPRVLLIDADLRRPAIATLCGIEGEVGLTTVLVGSIDPEDAIIVWADGLHVLPSGALPPNPGQLLGSAAMKELVKELSAEYDFIVIDSSPLLPATDALGLAHITDGSIVVARFKSTRRQQLSNTLEALNRVNARILGIVLNQVREAQPQDYGAPTPRQRGIRIDGMSRSVPFLDEDTDGSEIPTQQSRTR